MASLFDALFRGLRGEGTAAVKESKEAGNSHTPLLADDALATQSDSGDSDKENVLDITGLSVDPDDGLPIVMSPIRSGETNSSFGNTTSTLESTTLSTPGVDVSFGPQGTPYVIRRRPPLREVNTLETPSRAPHNTPESGLYRPPPRRTAAISIRHPDGSMDEVEHVIDLALPATAWRQEQVKYVRKARLNPNFKPRNIPTLHGPLSLPYARNPRRVQLSLHTLRPLLREPALINSGVDAIIIDDAAYPTATHGTRKEPFKSQHNAPFSSVHNPPMKSSDLTYTTCAQPAQPGPLASNYHTKMATATPVVRPLIVRDAKEILSLRQSSAVQIRDPKMASIPEEIKLPAKPVVERKESNPEAQPPRSTSLPASMILKSQANVARANESASEPSLPITDPFDGLFNQALANAAKQANTSGGDNTFTPSYDDLKAIWAAATEHYSRKASASSEPVQSELSQDASIESTGSSGAGFPPGTFSTPVKIPASTVVSSKADKSANWRNKIMEMTTPGGREIPAIAVTSPSAAEDNSSTMTIDSLFQKFNNLDDKSSAPADQVAKSADPAIKETSDTPMKPTKTIKPAHNTRRPLGEAKPSVLNPASKKAPPAGAKGTPNARKLLKKKVEITETPQVSAKAKGKQKAE